MHKRLKSLENVELFEDEVVGPELIGTIEYEHGGRHEFYGAVIPTTYRVFLRIAISDDEIRSRDVMYSDITGISRENLLMVGNILHIWTGNEKTFSLKSLSDGRLGRFLDFLIQYRSRALHIEKGTQTSRTQNAV